MLPVDKNVVRRFWENVEPGPENGCWVWKGPRREGYGRIQIQGKKLNAHRISFEIHKGAIPEGKIVCHRCNNPPCCNPNHLYAGTDRQNWEDSLLAGTTAACPKLTDSDVKAIRESSETHSCAAKRYGIGWQQVRRIRRREAWGHLLEQPRIIPKYTAAPKLDSDVRQIIREHRRQHKLVEFLAMAFGVSTKHIRKVRHGK